MKILAIDTSCDETSIAISENDRILSNQLSSQIESHKEWGGVVPSLAKRKHIEMFDLVLSMALKQAKVKLEDIDFFAVTAGPGLAIALEVGITKAKELALKYNKPLDAVNHMEGHLYSAFARNQSGRFYSKNDPTEITFPAIVLLVSGGHTEIVFMKNHGEYGIIGETLDDAIGETFDKVGRMLGLGYPAGSVIEKLAEKGNENAYQLPIPMRNSGDLNMSYSGLKTAAMKLINEELGSLNEYGAKFEASLQTSHSLSRSRQNKISNTKATKPNTRQITLDICASFQKNAIDQIIIKLEKAIKINPEIKDIILGGGVAQNKYLRKKLRNNFPKHKLYYPQNKKLYTDNAGMIAIAAYYNILRKNYLCDPKQISALDRMPNWRVDTI
jgi:N6-L-threonylcarbamoyladenine synthase